ncbi:MAG TPA: MerR family transcriptional regulator [Mycobacteriales bacterium]|nr:MerR family transcriptional regulator [Mycobacteriales bacterium]
MSTHSTWKVGPLATASGLTVRTLHHWDARGVVRPSGCSPSGHREYTEADVVRLYQVPEIARAVEALGDTAGSAAGGQYRGQRATRSWPGTSMMPAGKPWHAPRRTTGARWPTT